jgi:hypothetical protein
VDVEQPVGQALSRILAPGPDAERSIDAFIEKRHAERVRREGDRRVEEAWKESTRKHAAKQRQQARLEWHAHHAGQAERLRRTLEDLIDYHEQRAEELA